MRARGRTWKPPLRTSETPPLAGAPALQGQAAAWSLRPAGGGGGLEGDDDDEEEVVDGGAIAARPPAALRGL